MLKPSLRLQREEIAQAVARGRAYPGRILALRVLSAAGPSRLALVVSPKQVRLAVGRHRLKRRLRALIQQIAPQIPAGSWIIIFVSKLAVPLTPRELKAELVKQLKQCFPTSFN